MSIYEQLRGQLQAGGIEQISRQLGVDEQQVGTVVAGALPALLGGLARNSADAQGAASLAGALDRDHDGSALDDLVGFLGGSGVASQGAGILGHLFGGGQRAGLESTLAKTSGLDTGTVSKILAMLAPLVMGALGRQKRSAGLGSSDLASMLQNETQQVRQSDDSGLLGRLLDADGDGDTMDDIAKMGAGVLGGLFGKR